MKSCFFFAQKEVPAILEGVLSDDFCGGLADSIQAGGVGAAVLMSDRINRLKAVF